MLYLHCDEQQAAYFAAREHFDRRTQALDHMAERQFDLELEYQQLHRMLLQPEARNPAAQLFSSVDELRRELSPNEAAYLIEQHMEEQEREAAAWRAMPEDPHLRQIALALGLPETTRPDDLVDAVAAMAATLRSVSEQHG